MSQASTSVVYLTAGAAGMYCGSCMHDNTLARALSRQGVDVVLVPTYTPIRTDEEDVSIDRVFYGGISVYLEQILPAYRYLAPLLTPLVDRPWLLRLATRRAAATSAASLGELTISMLNGTAGRQRRELLQLCDWLATQVRPRLVVLSNILIAGCLPELKRRHDVPALVTLQGDDIFLEALSPEHREQAKRAIQKLVGSVDGFLVHSQYYADFMSDYLRIPAAKFHQIPLGIDTSDFARLTPREPQAERLTIGYLARLAPEKGLHVLVDAFLQLRNRFPDSKPRLRVAGYLGPNHRAYADEQFAKLDQSGLGGDFEYVGSLDRGQKVEFLRSLDVLSVPTTYREPKGLFVLEALAAGVPVVQPAHGAFPELIAELSGGELVPPHDPAALADALQGMLTDEAKRKRLAEEGRARVLGDRHADAMAEATWETWRRFLL